MGEHVVYNLMCCATDTIVQIHHLSHVYLVCVPCNLGLNYTLIALAQFIYIVLLILQ